MREPGERFEPAMLDGLAGPVQRYFAHALAPRAPLSRGVRLELSGRIKVGTWLRFASVWEGDGRSFSWRAKAGPGPLPFLRVHDGFRDRRGVMDVRLRAPLPRLPALRLVHAEDDDTARSGAGRAALEAVWAPHVLLPRRGVQWRAESDEVIVASWEVPPERPEVRFAVGPDGAPRSYGARRWRGAKEGYVPFGAEVEAERRFGALTIPSRITAGWGFGTADWSPFFSGEVTALTLID